MTVVLSSAGGGSRASGSLVEGPPAFASAQPTAAEPSLVVESAVESVNSVIADKVERFVVLGILEPSSLGCLRIFGTRIGGPYRLGRRVLLFARRASLAACSSPS